MVLCEGDVWFYVSWPLCVLGVAQILGSFSQPSRFVYYHMKKPGWFPPPIVFPVVWTILYILLGVAAARVHILGGWGVNTYPLIVFSVHMVLNALWTPIFFGLQNFFVAMLWVLLLLALCVWNIVLFFDVDALAGWLLIPYLLWLLFAFVLSLMSWRCNCGWVPLYHDYFAIRKRCEDAETWNAPTPIGTKLDQSDRNYVGQPSSVNPRNLFYF